MSKDLVLTLSPEEAVREDLLRTIASKKLGMGKSNISSVSFLKRSIDARRGTVKVNANVRVFLKGEEIPPRKMIEYRDAGCESVVIVGSGPAGLFAALTLLEHGVKPIVLERGKDVSDRKRDAATLNRDGILDPESNYCFGLGGAGTFSDGKLYTRSTKRGDVGKVLATFAKHGAPEEILYDAHPHIGTEKLPGVISKIKETILVHGGEVHFSHRVTGLLRKGGAVVGAKCSDGSEFLGPVVLATGHSAHDVYRFLLSEGYSLEAKDVAIGVRMEHPQSLIDRIQYHGKDGRGKYLPPATYKLVTQVGGRGVYSFCMCPGGFVVPSSTEAGTLSVNGMSPSSRGSLWANSGIVTEYKLSDIDSSGPLSMMENIESIERKCFFEGYKAPAVRMVDFISHKVSKSLPKSSYIPGLVPSELDGFLPLCVTERLRRGLSVFNGFTGGKLLVDDALLIAPETRTSSPVRILRNDDFSQVPGLYPAGEGAGYAGGIVSAALDGVSAALHLISSCYPQRL